MSEESNQPSTTIGLPPGALVHVGKKRVDRTSVTITDYDEHDINERGLGPDDDYQPYLQSQTVSWINVIGLHEPDIIGRMGKAAGLHVLEIEDILNTGQRPKMQERDDHIFVSIKMLYRSKTSGDIVSEQVSLVLLENAVVTFQEVHEDVFDLIRDRIRKTEGRIRRMKADYLFYALIDAIVDNYFVVLEEVGEDIDSLQDEVIEKPAPRTLGMIHQLKRDLVALRKVLWPTRELLSLLERSETPLIREGTRIFLRDVHEHVIRVIDTIETYRDTVSGTLDIYLSSVSNRMNETMKVLTIIATLFIPLTFIVGVYGMNFQHMPELTLRWGYPAVWGVMIALAVTMAVYFKRKNWI